MRLLIAVLGLAALMMNPAATAAAQNRPVYYLHMVGSAHYLYRIMVNGEPVLQSADLVSLGPRPYYISRYLKGGRNEITVEFASDPKEPMALTVEARDARGRLAPVTSFHTAAGKDNGQRLVKILSFSARLAAPVVLSDGGHAEIATLLQGYYDALARRDARGVLHFYEPTVKAYAQIDPETAAVARRVLARDAEMCGKPQFRMKPYEPAGLQTTVIGQVVRVTRPGGIVMESEPFTVEATTTFDGGKGSYRVKVKEQLEQQSFEFERINGAWNFAAPVF